MLAIVELKLLVRRLIDSNYRTVCLVVVIVVVCNVRATGALVEAKHVRLGVVRQRNVDVIARAHFLVDLLLLLQLVLRMHWLMIVVLHVIMLRLHHGL